MPVIVWELAKIIFVTGAGVKLIGSGLDDTGNGTLKAALGVGALYLGAKYFKVI